MPYNIILYFRLFIFMSLIVLYFLHSTSVLSFHIDVVLTLSITDAHEFDIITYHMRLLIIDIDSRTKNYDKIVPGVNKVIHYAYKFIPLQKIKTDLAM